jgi:type II secretory pathway pseudopilin PulG
MLVAVAIILVLVSLIIPALNMVKESAGMARQRAQFHSIDIALEAFRADDGDYPPSGDNVSPTDAYPGAMKLAEALIGQDGFGFHPRSEFRNDGLADLNGDDVYDDPCESVYPDSPADENLAIRRGPYLELETANAVRLRDIYDLANEPDSLYGLKGKWFVLGDMFRLVKNNATGKRTGMPILYYKANTSNFRHNPATYSEDLFPVNKCIYDHFDNWRILELEALWEGAVKHPMRLLVNPIDGPALFYKNTTNPNFSTPPMRPYRADSYILLSAGPDGLYGTPDDVFNFNKGE